MPLWVTYPWRSKNVPREMRSWGGVHEPQHSLAGGASTPPTPACVPCAGDSAAVALTCLSFPSLCSPHPQQTSSCRERGTACVCGGGPGLRCGEKRCKSQRKR